MVIEAHRGKVIYLTSKVNNIYALMMDFKRYTAIIINEYTLYLQLMATIK